MTAMTERRLDTETLELMAAFEDRTGVQPIDCVEAESRVVFVVPEEDAGRAIGRDGQNVERLRRQMGKHVQIVPFSDDPAEFVEAYFYDVGVEDVEVEERGDRRIARVQVPARHKARAIGRGGSNVKLATKLTRRHHDLEVVVD